MMRLELSGFHKYLFASLNGMGILKRIIAGVAKTVYKLVKFIAILYFVTKLLRFLTGEQQRQSRMDEYARESKRRK